MMKKVIVFGIALFSLLLVATPILAQQDTQIYPIPPYRDNPTQILGQDHAYSVTFRGNGEAVVSAKVVFTNITDNPLDTISLRVPKVDAKDVIVFQVLRDKTCIGGYQQQSQEARPGTPLLCNQYQDPDYYGYYGNSKYQKAQSDLHGDTIDITLPQPVKVNRSGAFLVYYRAFGYAKKNIFGAYTFTFETLKVEDKIRNLTVGISTDSDLVLKGAKGKVNYRFNEASMMALKSSDAGVAMASPQFDQYYQQIGYGTITKNASNLQPLDSYSVKGAYAENSLMLYGKEVSIMAISFLLGIILIVIIGKKTFHWLTTNKKSSVTSETFNSSFLTSTGLGFVASISIIFYTVGLMIVNMLLRQVFGYDESLFIIHALLVIISLAIYGLLLFVPSVVVGVKKGLSWGLGTFISTIIWLIVDMIFTGIILMFVFGFRNRPLPIPYLENIMGGGMMRANVEKSSEGVPMMQQIEEESSGATQQLPQ